VCRRARVATVKLERHKMHLQNDCSTGLITEEGRDLQLKLYAVRFFNESKFSTLARAPTSSANSAGDLHFLSFPSLGARKEFNGFSKVICKEGYCESLTEPMRRDEQAV
jgi:hypothetical protein